MKVGIKYCGGCNPRYDRVAAVNQLKRESRRWNRVSLRESGL